MITPSQLHFMHASAVGCHANSEAIALVKINNYYSEQCMIMEFKYGGW